MVCKCVLYSGRVQGVGFRYTTQALAADYAIAGYVRNLANGEVELVAEGEAEVVEAFLAAVAERMANYITNAAIEERAPSGQHGFRIRY